MSAPALFPLDRWEGASVFVEVDRDWLIVANTSAAYVGYPLFSLAGIEASFGDDYRYVMESRRPLTVRRWWSGHVWDATIRPTDVGVRLDATSLLKLGKGDKLTLHTFASFWSRASEALAAGAPSPAHQPQHDLSAPAAGAARLRVLPAPE